MTEVTTSCASGVVVVSNRNTFVTTKFASARGLSEFSSTHGCKSIITATTFRQSSRAKWTDHSIYAVALFPHQLNRAA